MSDYETMNYEFDESSAVKADEARLDTSGAYVCKIVEAQAIVSQEKGTHGVLFKVTSEGNGDAEFTLYTKKADGKPIFGYNQLQAILMLTGVRNLRGAKGLVSKWDNEIGERVEVEGTVFPDLAGKKVGLVFQKEMYTSNSGKDSFRMNMVGSFHYETRLTCSELKERKVKPEKLEKQLSRLQDKDSRKTPEPAMVASSTPSYAGNF